MDSLPASVDIPEVSSPELTDAREETVLDLTMTWSGKKFALQVPDQDRIYDLKNMIWSLTEVPPERLKILGLTTSKLQPIDSDVIGELQIKKGGKFMALGTSEANSFKDPTRLQKAEVQDDLDVDYAAEKVQPADDPRNKRKIREKTAALDIELIHSLRPGKKLLVLDLDYTLCDTKPLVSGSLSTEECARPGLHAFLKAVYAQYDICIWSQTSWRWLESKLTELAMLGEEEERGYKIAFVIDRRPMYKIFTTQKKGGVVKEHSHEVKSLQILWNRFPQFGPENTVHIDDLQRNFATNPKQGLKIKAFKGAGTAAARADKELWRLADYLLRLAALESFLLVDHAVDWPAFRKHSHR